MTIPLTLGQTAVIDDADASLVAGVSWHAQPRRDWRGFYAVDSRGRKMHRVLLQARPGEIVDHRDGDGLNNRRANIRIGTQSGNCVNRRSTPGVYLRGARLKRGCCPHGLRTLRHAPPPPTVYLKISSNIHRE